jgi:hypothetical protein
LVGLRATQRGMLRNLLVINTLCSEVLPDVDFSETVKNSH